MAAALHSFEEFLKAKHAEEYHGTDDEMPDHFELWLSTRDPDELIDYAVEWGKSILESQEELQEETRTQP